MIVTSSQISWGKYQQYEGPYFKGVQKFALSDNPDTAEKYLAIITASEGGHYDAINMYDRGIISVGLIQWIEAGQMSVSDMIGEASEVCGEHVQSCLNPAMTLCNVKFKKNVSGKWRFVDSRGAEFAGTERSRALFLGGSGLIGSWTPDTKNRAKTWASCVANIWSDERARRAQNEFTRSRLDSFVWKEAKQILFGSDADASDPAIAALQALYVSYAINLPAVANNAAQIAARTLKSKKWSDAWCAGFAKILVLNPKIGIWPARYNATVPLLDRMWDVKFPPSATALADFNEKDDIELRPKQRFVTPEQLEIVISDAEKEEIQTEESVNLPTSEDLPTIPAIPSLVVPKPNPGFLGFIMWFISVIMLLLSSGKKKDKL